MLCLKAVTKQSMGVFFWDYSGIGILGIDGICVLLGAIPFSKWTEYHSVHSASDSRMNRMKGMRFTRNRQNTRSFGKFLAGNPTRPSTPVACVDRSSEVTPDSVSRSETGRSIVFEIEIPCILLILNRNKNSQNSPKRMHPINGATRKTNLTIKNFVMAGWWWWWRWWLVQVPTWWWFREWKQG